MPLRLKDILTLGNLLSGAAAIVLCIDGRADVAPWAFIVAYVFDVSDGLVARLTGGGNRFGAELDNLADHLTFGVAPAFLVYAAHRDTHPWIGMALGAALVVASTIRHVRNLVFEAPITLCWIGLARPAAGLTIVAFTRSALFHWGGPWISLPLVLAVAWSVVSTFPTLNHRGRAFQPWVRASIWAWVIGWLAVFLFLRNYFWDFALFCLVFYAGFSWLALEPTELDAYREMLKSWKQTVTQGMAANGGRGDASPRQGL
ncbi:MAG: CDP-alcohol phosphatidyltransferase family protein [Myxococcota bacterium]